MPAIRSIDQEMNDLLAVYRQVTAGAPVESCLLAERLYA
jgi:hypothetical protein